MISDLPKPVTNQYLAQNKARAELLLLEILNGLPAQPYVQRTTITRI